MPVGAYYPQRDGSANSSVSKGLSHYPQHIIAQAEAQKGQQLVTQQARESGASANPSSSSSRQQQGGSGLSRTTTQGNHVQIALSPASSSDGLNIQHYQPAQQPHPPSQNPEKRATRSSTNANAGTSASSASGRSTRLSTRGSQRQAQQQQQQVLASVPSTSVPSATEAPTTFVAVMSQFPVSGLVDGSHAGS